MKIAAVVILYHPEPGLPDKIRTYQHAVHRVYAIDNTEHPAARLAADLAELQNCRYISDGVNKGIAARLNEACGYALQEGCTYLLTMDQDSAFEPDGFSNYLQRVNAFPNPGNVAVFSVNYQPDITPADPAPREVPSAITSGSLVNLALHAVIGRFSEALFIDLVDAEYSYRAVKLHYRIIQFRDIILLHRLGFIRYGRSLKTFRRTPRILHSPVRMYYIVRNCLYMLYRFQGLAPAARKEIINCLMLVKNNILYHDQRCKVLKYIVKGYRDFRKNNMGRIDRLY